MGIEAAIIGGAALGAGASIIEGQQNRKAQEKANKQNRKQEALNNLVNLMMGGKVQSTPMMPVQGSTGSDALAGLGQISQAYAQGQMMESQRKNIDARTQAITSSGGGGVGTVDFDEVIGSNLYGRSPGG